MGRADHSKGVFHKREDFFHSRAQLETRQLELTGEMTHVFAGGGQQIYAARSELCGFGLRARAPSTDHDSVCHPPRERIEELTIIDRSGGQIKAAEPSSFVTLHMQFKAIPPIPFLDLQAHYRKVRCWRARATWQTANAVESCNTMG